MLIKIWLQKIYQATHLAAQTLLLVLAIPIASQANPFPLPRNNQPQIINQPSNYQAQPQFVPGYVLVTPKYARPAMAPDLTFVLPYNFPFNSVEPGQGFNAAPNQPFIQQFNQFPYQIPGQLPSQTPSPNQQLGQPIYQPPHALSQLSAPLPLGQGKIIRQN